MLLTTQYLDEADELAARIAVIDHGRVVAEGTPTELKASVGAGTLRIRLIDPAQPAEAGRMLSGLLGVPGLARARPGTADHAGPGRRAAHREDRPRDPPPPLEGQGQEALHLLVPRVHHDQARSQVRPAEGPQLDQDPAPAVPGQHAGPCPQPGNHRCQVADLAVDGHQAWRRVAAAYPRPVVGGNAHMRGQQRHDPLPGRGPVVHPRLEHDGGLAGAGLHPSHGPAFGTRVSPPHARPPSRPERSGDRRSRGRARYDLPESGGPGWTLP